MKKLYCNGKKDFCERYDGNLIPNCDECNFFDDSGAEVVEENDNTESEGGQ